MWDVSVTYQFSGGEVLRGRGWWVKSGGGKWETLRHGLERTIFINRCVRDELPRLGRAWECGDPLLSGNGMFDCGVCGQSKQRTRETVGYPLLCVVSETSCSKIWSLWMEYDT
ncbi:unnamed protein product [Chondrus crispus]|uniref:Uncharacterized protein n=1 Tax=Chondrus crispus TaxID=2769 RepID=R7QN49_CHOCR|nr:unnamed protein product [Chondrus crispus]CDF39208.1 unnamed protein product [Chondrus crispus]|eukprot:XP_005719119.1 unnamed protein product [Chondrus crispus]